MPSPDNILITGGFGFLGGHLAKALLESGFNVTLFDNCAWHSSPASSMQISSLSGLARLQGSVLNHDDLLLAGNGFDYIIHAAGFLGIRRVAENPISTLDVNVIGTRHVLELACAQRQLKKFLFFSSSEVYGHQAHSSFEDDDAIVSTTSPRWSYAASKLAGEFYVKGFGQEHALPFVIV